MDYLSRIVGDPIENFSGRKLPTVVEVMSVFLYQKKVLKFQQKHGISLTIAKVQEKWSEADIPTCGKVYAQRKLSSLLEEVKKLQKNSKRKKSVSSSKDEKVNFFQKLKQVFDIVKLNVEKYIDKEKPLFLTGQRSKNRFGFIDNDTSTQSEDIIDVDSADADEPADNMMFLTQKSSVFLSDLSVTTSSPTSNVVSDFENQLIQQCQTNKINVMTPELCAALDRVKITNRNATFILAAAYKSLGFSLSTLNLSYSTIYRARIKHRANIAQDLKREFHLDDRYVVHWGHWDGKILCDIVDSASVDEAVANALNEYKIKIINFINGCLQMSQPRDNYQELLLLSLVFLDSYPTDTYTFKRPGAMHHARWMSKAIYSLKMFMFRDQFHLSSLEINSLRQICIFVILLYIEAWYTSTSAILAPNTDLELLKKLILYKNINPVVSKEACKKMKEHFWYLNNELATTSLFDDNVPIDIKKKMVHAVNNREGSTLFDQRYYVDDVNLKSILDNDLSDFVSKNSLDLFKKFDLPSDFIEKEIKPLPNDDSFKICLKFFNTLNVTNDVAERGIALIEDYNCCQTQRIVAVFITGCSQSSKTFSQ